MGPTARARLSRRIRARLADEGGFTLPELLIVVAILLIVITSLTSVLVSATHTEVDASLRFQAQGQARAGLDQLRREIHCAGTVTNTSGGTLTAGTSYSAISFQLSSVCPTASGVARYVTWCTSPTTISTGGHVALYRVSTTALPRPTCSSSGKVKWADYLTTVTPFCVPSTTAACSGVLKPTTSLPMLHVAMPVNLNGLGATKDGYNLYDDIALRNGTRS
jgi:prepilin-type N-terminal cleavage/methylation domain-containing protein